MDEYKTVGSAGSGLYKAKGSKFFGFAYPFRHEDELNALLDPLKVEHHKARHWCYAYRIGTEGLRWRANDDGEPSSSAGRPILGEIDRRELTYALVVVVRYFGGTKLGVPGLIEAYREAAAAALDASEIVDGVETKTLTITTDYVHLADLMNAVKQSDFEIANQVLDVGVRLDLEIARSRYRDASASLWCTLAGKYPGEEQLDQHPPGYNFGFTV